MWADGSPLNIERVMHRKRDWWCGCGWKGASPLNTEGVVWMHGKRVVWVWAEGSPLNT